MMWATTAQQFRRRLRVMCDASTHLLAVWVSASSKLVGGGLSYVWYISIIEWSMVGVNEVVEERCIIRDADIEIRGGTILHPW